jgi:hypothetical protein
MAGPPRPRPAGVLVSGKAPNRRARRLALFSVREKTVDWSFAANGDALACILLRLKANTRRLIRLTTVCVSWRRIILDTPDLWAIIIVGRPAVVSDGDYADDGVEYTNHLELNQTALNGTAVGCWSRCEEVEGLKRLIRCAGMKLTALNLYGCCKLNKLLSCLSPAQVAGLKELRVNGSFYFSAKQIFTALRGAQLHILDLEHLLVHGDSYEERRDLLDEAYAFMHPTHADGFISTELCITDNCGCILNADEAHVCCLHDDSDDGPAYLCPNHAKTCCKCFRSVCKDCLPALLENVWDRPFGEGLVCFQCDKIICAACTSEILDTTDLISCFTCGCCQRDFCLDCNYKGVMCGKHYGRYADADPEMCYRFVCESCFDTDDEDGVPAMHFCSIGMSQDHRRGQYCRDGLSWACRKCILRDVRRGIKPANGGWTVRRMRDGEFWAACGKCMMDRKAAKKDAAAKPK